MFFFIFYFEFLYRFCFRCSRSTWCVYCHVCSCRKSFIRIPIDSVFGAVAQPQPDAFIVTFVADENPGDTLVENEPDAESTTGATAPIEETAPVGETQKPASVGETQESAPAEEAAPVEEAVNAKESTPAVEEAVNAKESTPAEEETVNVGESAPVQEQEAVNTKESVPAEKAAESGPEHATADNDSPQEPQDGDSAGSLQRPYSMDSTLSTCIQVACCFCYVCWSRTRCLCSAALTQSRSYTPSKFDESLYMYQHVDSGTPVASDQATQNANNQRKMVCHFEIKPALFRSVHLSHNRSIPLNWCFQKYEGHDHIKIHRRHSGSEPGSAGQARYLAQMENQGLKPHTKDTLQKLADLKAAIKAASPGKYKIGLQLDLRILRNEYYHHHDEL